MLRHTPSRTRPARRLSAVAALAGCMTLLAVVGCDDGTAAMITNAAGYSDWGYGAGYDAGWGGYESGWGSGGELAGYGFTDHTSTGQQMGSFSLGADPGESLQNYLSSYVTY